MRLFVAVYPPAPAVADLAGLVSSLHVGRAAAAGVNTRLAKPAAYHLTLAFLGGVPDERLADVEVAVGQAVDRYHARAATVARRATRARARQRTDPAANGDADPRFAPPPGPSPAADPVVRGGDVDSGVVSRPGSSPAAEGADSPAQAGDVEAAFESGSGPRLTREGADPAVRRGPLSEVEPAGRRRTEAWPVVPELALAGGGRFGRGAFTVMWVGVSGDLEPMRALHQALRRELKHARFPYDERPWKPHLTVARPGDRIPRAEVDADREALDAYAGPTWPAGELVLVRSHLGPDPTYERLTNWLF